MQRATCREPPGLLSRPLPTDGDPVTMSDDTFRNLYCPKCGSDEIAKNYLLVEIRDPWNGRVFGREETGAYENAIGGWKWCCECGHDFNNPLREKPDGEPTERQLQRMTEGGGEDELRHQQSEARRLK